MPRAYKLNHDLPKNLRDKLENPSTEPGTRHAEMTEVVLQMVGNGIPDDEIFRTMRTNYPTKPEKEIRDSIYGAHKRNPIPTIGTINTRMRIEKINHCKFRVKREETDGLPEPIKTRDSATMTFLETVFRPEEVVCITNSSNFNESDGKHIIADKGTFWTLEKWREFFTSGRTLDKDSGAWVRINPCREIDRSDEKKDDKGCTITLERDGKSGTDMGVSDYRHCLIEFDGTGTPEEIRQQWAIFKQSGLPIASVLSSGGKSLHAWVRVDAHNLDEFKVRRDAVYSYLEEYKPDPANKNPSRWSRLPGVMRGDKEQELLSLAMGAGSWAEWESSVQDHELPEEVSISELEEFDRDNDPKSLIGSRWLCEGGSMILQGQSGIGKSSFLMQTACTFALGRDFFGIKPRGPLRSLVMQAENDAGDMAEMYQDVRDGMQLDTGERKQLREYLRFYREQSRTGLEFLRVADRLIRKTKAQLIFADPLLAYVGGDISKQEIASQFLRNWLNPILSETGVIWIWLHHVGKPKASQDTKGQNSKDLSYAGFGSSELVNWAREVATLTRAEQSRDVYRLTLSKRGKRSGMIDREGKQTDEILLQHSRERIHWERAEPRAKINKGDGGGMIADDGEDVANPYE